MRTGAAPVSGWILAAVVVGGVVAGIVAVSGGFGGSQRAQFVLGPLSTRVDSAEIRVMDGDTIAIGPEKVRLMGFDAPETFRSRCLKERERGERAKARLVQLVRNGRLGLERRGRDRYGRTLAVLAVNGRDVAEIMIAEGLARPYHGKRRKSWCD